MPLNPHQRRALAAIADTIFPPGSENDPDEPGGAALDAHIYVIRALEGPYAHHLAGYVAAIEALDRAAGEHGGASFAGLGEADRTALLEALSKGEIGDSATFFPTLRGQILEGVWGDPSHGGNRNKGGWKLVGYPGAQLRHDPKELQARRKSR